MGEFPLKLLFLKSIVICWGSGFVTLDVTWIAKSDWNLLGKYFSASSFNIVVILSACFWETQKTKVLPISFVYGSLKAFWINALQNDKFVSSDLNFLS